MVKENEGANSSTNDSGSEPNKTINQNNSIAKTHMERLEGLDEQENGLKCSKKNKIHL